MGVRGGKEEGEVEKGEFQRENEGTNLRGERVKEKGGETEDKICRKKGSRGRNAMSSFGGGRTE